METLDEVLEHYGIKGMKWGVRRDRATLDRLAGRRSTNRRAKRAAKADVKKRKSSTASEDAKRAAEIAKKVKKGDVSSLSNQELQQLNNRLQLEQSYSRLTTPSQNKVVNAGSKFAKELVVNLAKEQARSFANQQVAKAIGTQKKKR